MGVLQVVEIYYKLIGYVELPKMRLEEREAYLKAFGKVESSKSA